MDREMNRELHAGLLQEQKIGNEKVIYIYFYITFYKGGLLYKLNYINQPNKLNTKFIFKFLLIFQISKIVF